MKKSITVNAKKSRGRPVTTGTGTVVGVRLLPQPLSAIDKWSAAQDDCPARPEAIRRLVEIGLAADRPAARTSSKTAARAAELASQAIDRQSDPTAPAEERATRKRRILKGPSMARGLRKDR